VALVLVLLLDTAAGGAARCRQDFVMPTVAAASLSTSSMA